MQCRNCGTEIADKALICFRCGTATAEPRVPAPGLKVRPSPALLVLGLVLLVLGAALITLGTRSPVPPPAAYALAAAGAAAVGMWVARRR
jgi:hypothetical protein